MSQFKNFQVRMVPITTSRQYGPDGNLCDFFNQGTTDVKINGRLLLPKTGFAVLGWPGEVDITSYEIVFNDATAAGNLVIVTIKSYV